MAWARLQGLLLPDKAEVKRLINSPPDAPELTENDFNTKLDIIPNYLLCT